MLMAPQFLLYLISLLLSQIAIATAATVYYEFNLTLAVIAPDCVSKRVPTINGEYPGPIIHATSGDRVVVKVCNFVYVGAAIHWHGMHMKREQWMDGPAFGAQCPIRKGQCYTYNYSTTDQVGTFWYHGHIALLRNTIYGALIVHPKPNAVVPFPKPTDEFVVLLNDWYHTYSGDLINNLQKLQFGGPDSLLINGRGLYPCSNYVCAYTNNPSKCGVCNATFTDCNPLTTFVVKNGGTYRFRVVNVALFAQQNFAIEGHSLTIVMADGYYLKPANFTSLDILPGQAFDVLVTFNQKPKNYWVTSTGQYDSAGLSPPGLAVVKYDQKSNPVFSQQNPTTAYTITGPFADYAEELAFGPTQQYQLKNYYTVKGFSSKKVDKYFSIMWSLNSIDGNPRYAVNNQSYYGSWTPLLASEYFNLTGAFEAPNEIPPHFTYFNSTGLAPAIYAASVLSVKKGEFVQLVLQNHPSVGGNHPWHLHGMDFYVVYNSTGVYDRSLEAEYEKHYNLVDPPRRNMLTVYDSTFAVIRIQADNVGIWPLHCHLEPHLELGMQVYFRVVGEPGDIPPPPKDLLKCGKLKNLLKNV